jgi:hypothetical protein
MQLSSGVMHIILDTIYCVSIAVIPLVSLNIISDIRYWYFCFSYMILRTTVYVKLSFGCLVESTVFLTFSSIQNHRITESLLQFSNIYCLWNKILNITKICGSFSYFLIYQKLKWNFDSKKAIISCMKLKNLFLVRK